MKTFRFKKKRSFTVVEMMVALILFSVIMFVLLSLMTQAQNIMRRGVSKANVFEDAMIVLNRIGDDLSCADFTLETEEAYFKNGTPHLSTLEVEPNKCTILTRRYDGTSMLCKVEYVLQSNSLRERVYNFDKDENDFEITPSSEQTLLENVVALEVIAGSKSYETIDQNDEINPNDGKAEFDTREENFHPFYVTIRLVLMDDDTRIQGATQQQIQDNDYPSSSTIKNKIGSKKFNASVRVFTRTITLNLSALDPQK